MTDPTLPPGDDPDGAPDRASATGTPRWVKVSLIITGLVALLVLVLLVVGGGPHGPGRHMPSGGGDVSPSSSVGDDHTPPAGGHG